jgi:hypothetical protein
MALTDLSAFLAGLSLSSTAYNHTSHQTLVSFPDLTVIDVRQLQLGEDTMLRQIGLKENQSQR